MVTIQRRPTHGLPESAATAFGTSFCDSCRHRGDERRPPGDHQHSPCFLERLLEPAAPGFGLDPRPGFLQQTIGLARRD
jgi:hypothetical protein